MGTGVGSFDQWAKAQGGLLAGDKLLFGGFCCSEQLATWWWEIARVARRNERAWFEWKGQ